MLQLIINCHIIIMTIIKQEQITNIYCIMQVSVMRFDVCCVTRGNETEKYTKQV